MRPEGSRPAPVSPGARRPAAVSTGAAPRPRHARPATAALVLALVAGSCGDRSAGVPPGTALLGRGDAVREILAALEGFGGTPLARRAADAGARLAGCDEVFGHCPGPGPECSLFEALACSDPEDALSGAVRELRAESAWLLTHRAEGTSLVARGEAGVEGRWRVTGTLEVDGEAGAIGLLLPAQEGAGPASLASEEAVFQARVRPRGVLDTAALGDADDWAGRLFKLQAGLFVDLALHGTWEVAVYTPEEGEQIPPIALALDFTDRERAVEGMERFVREVMRTWPVLRRDATIEGYAGACLANLRLLPELLPCYVATDRALVVGWNALAVEKAVAPGPRRDAAADASWAELAMARLPEADERLRRASGGRVDVPPSYPWQRLALRGRWTDGAYRLELEAVGSAPSAAGAIQPSSPGREEGGE